MTKKKKQIKLTDDQSKQVEDNYKLIYWYAGLKHLDIEEWYGLLAIELCNTVQKHDPKKSSLSNYYKLRCDSLVHKEYQKYNADKRTHNGMVDIEDLYSIEKVSNTQEFFDNIDNILALTDLFDGKDGDIIKLKWEGYTQMEIAEMMGISQSQISNVLREARLRYEQE